MRKSKYYLLLLLVFTLHVVSAQVTVHVSMDTNRMMIGDQTNVVFEATITDSAEVVFPVFSDTIIDKLEILNISDIDTMPDNNGIRIIQKYLVTCFDSGWYAIPPQPIVVRFSDYTDTLLSAPIYFGVMTMPLDTVHPNAIADIKAPIGAPITFKEVLPFIEIGLAVLILALLIFILYKRYVKKEPVFVKKEKPKEPAHIIAFRELEELRGKKLWQKGKVKEYYSELTDILREYIEGRFEIPAMESTTEEIIVAFKKANIIDKELVEELNSLLASADFVKFAKASPLAEENEKSYKFVYDFVLNTKPVTVLRDDEDEANAEVEPAENSKQKEHIADSTQKR